KVRRRNSKRGKESPFGMSELFDNREKHLSDFTATLPDYRRKVEVIYNPDNVQRGEAELEDSLRSWREIDQMVEKIVDPREISKSMDGGDSSESEEEEIYTISTRPPTDSLSRNWVVFESFCSKDEVHHCYSLASIVLSKN
ncbi:hypothetical protein PMAYCL1PPCAC_30280, partial [Pristionchus mayeri]